MTEPFKELRAWAREREWKQAMRGVLVVLRCYARGLALLIQRPRVAQELQAREQKIKELESSLAKERRKARRLKKQRECDPSVGEVHFGDLRRLNPISRDFGLDRGQPIDRYYIRTFLANQADDIRGRVLEIQDAFYTRKYGGERVDVSDVLDVVEGNRQTTIVADLTRADNVPSDAFDCVILTQTLHLIYDVHSAIRTLYRILKPGGVLLATFPGITQVSCREEGSDYWYWAFTQTSARRLFEEAFPAANVEAEAHGNVLVATAFLHGLAGKELSREEFDHRDPDYEVLITLRAAKPEATP